MHSVSLVASYVYENVCDDGLQLVTRKTNVAMYAQFRSNARYVSNGHNAALGSQFTDAHYCTHKIPIFSIMIQSKKKKVININARDFINRWYFVAARLILKQSYRGVTITYYCTYFIKKDCIISLWIFWFCFRCVCNVVQ